MKPHYVPRALVIPGLVAFYRFALHPALPLPIARRVLDLAARVTALPDGAAVLATRLAGVPAERITVGASERPRAILYLHGGGFTIGSMRTHRSAAAYLAREAGAVVYCLGYRLAPEHPYPAGVDDAIWAFRALVDEHGLDPAAIAISGDSSGGGMAVTVARRLIDEHGLTAGALALFSPWTDLADDGEYTHDLVVGSGWARRNGARYVGDLSPADPGVSPARGNLAGLPPMWVLTTTPELLHDQVIRFVDAVRAAGGEVAFFEHPTLWHSGHTQASMVREAADVIHLAGVFLRSRLAVTTSPPATTVPTVTTGG